jgi:hypothetical protein
MKNKKKSNPSSPIASYVKRKSEKKRGSNHPSSIASFVHHKAKAK